MIKSLLESPISIFYAVLIHVGLIVVLIYSFDWQAEEDDVVKVKVMQATMVDESKIAKRIDKLKKEEKKKRREEDKRLEKERRQAEREKLKQQQDAKRQAEAQEKQQRQLEKDKQRKREERKAAKNQPPKVDKPKQQKPKPKPKDNSAEKRRAKLKAEKQRLAKIEQDKKKQADERRKEEQDLMMQQLAQEEEDMRLAELAAEQLELDDAKVGENSTRVQRISAMITQRITDNWRRNTAANLQKDLTCVLFVRLLPTGEVLNVEIIKSSGDAVFDKSVVNAVWKASPFPLSIDDRDIFDQIRELEIKFDPKV